MVGELTADVGRNKRFLREICNNFDHFETADILVADNTDSSLHGKAAAKDSEPSQNDPFEIRQEVVAPLHRRAQGLLARQGGTPTLGQQVETVRQPLSEAPDSERVYLDRRKLQSQRHAVEAATNR